MLNTSSGQICWLYLLLFSTVFFNTNCGKRRPPLPPSPRVSPSPNLNVAQQGDSVNLTITLSNINNNPIKEIEVYRLAQNAAQSSLYSEEEFAIRATLIGVIPVASETNYSPRTYSLSDQLNALQPGIKLNYAVRLINANERRSGFSTLAVIEPNFRVSQPPRLESLSNTEKEVLIRWQIPIANLDQTQPAALLGYNIYRRQIGVTPPDFKKLNSAPVTNTTFADTNFEFNQEYVYFVRSLSVGSNNALVESSDSNSFTIKLIDKFPPAAPQGLTIAAAPGRLSLFYAANSESDLAGYNIYRSTDPNKPLSEWTKLNQSLLTTTTYQDLQVESNQQYSYYLTAIDQAGNTSQPSAVVSETVP